MNELPRELMESHCANAQEATMQGFRASIIASMLTPAIERLMEQCYRMGFESGWRIREGCIEAGMTVFANTPDYGPCAVCGKPFVVHGSYPTCADHPYTGSRSSTVAYGVKGSGDA